MQNIQLFNDHFQNYKVYGIPKAQLVIADIPYNVGEDAYGSNPMWYKGGDNKNGESELAGKAFFDTDKDFRIAEYMHFCSNMRVVGNTEYAILLYRNRPPKFNNKGRMVFNAIPYPRDTETEKIHPTQKSVPLLRYLIELFTDEGDVVIDPCAGSGSTLLAAAQCGRKAYGFEIKKDFYKDATEKVLRNIQPVLF